MQISDNAIRVTSVKDIYIPIASIYRIVYESRTNEVSICTRRGTTTVLDPFHEFRDQFPDLCEER